MDITPGDFEDFSRSSSVRSRRSETRSSMRSETTGSLEILSSEEVKADDHLFMNEEVLDDENEPSPTTDRSPLPFMPSLLSKMKEDLHLETPSSLNSSRESTPSSNRSGESVEDPELARLIKKMKYYDKILLKKMKREKEVKLQGLLFQKQMLEEFSSMDSKNEEKLSVNETKFLALMPPPDQLQEMLYHLQHDEFAPIFPTQVNVEDDQKESTATSNGQNQGGESITTNESSPKSKRADSGSVNQSAKKKIDFIKRNIELARDAGNYISMTDDEKARLSELLSDLDNAEEEQEVKQAFSNPLAPIAEGYTPDENERKRLAEIDEKIQALLPEDEFNLICGTPHLGITRESMDQEMVTLGEKIYSKEAHSNERIEAIQQRLEGIDEDWKKTYEGITPRLTNEQLQRLLDECSLPRSSISSSLSLRTLSQTGDHEPRPRSEVSVFSHRTESGIDNEESENEEAAPGTNRSVVERLPQETLDRLLSEARNSLGIVPLEQKEDPDSGDDDGRSSRREKTPLFYPIARITPDDWKVKSAEVEITLDEVDTPRSSPEVR